MGSEKNFKYGDVLRNEGRKSQWHGKQKCKRYNVMMGLRHK